ncbi:hypothetical protein CO172_00155 [Candidatus Uhrbacteria bacterium CG_4_9_14_3_um_filter_36_7]|uniref:Glycosyltransferase subfamily 4-like N-terminal domain-containing protein n=1 Tax=Candidatus Uhrbacteria bacterium CG_4_9_14_3_um_filter_36_7 TaxID=1975033 RepID=A0A2M7XIJ0_9BACT|nr:MAG: hypothetical protein CO172_00155 [Candidatus Uhrbacteria bacterium CG_4_9_14_3_um_filter_36_7]
MKIVLISNLYPPIDRGGGAERVAQRIVHILQRHGHEVVVLSTKPFKGISSFTPKQDYIGAGYIFRLYPMNIYYILNDYKQWFPIRMLWHLLDLFSCFTNNKVKIFLEQEQPDIILTHNLKGIGLGIARAIRGFGRPWIHTLHDVQLSVPSGLLMYHKQHGLDYTFLRGWYERLVKFIFKSPDLVISPSAYLADFYKERGFFLKSQVIVLPNPAPENQVEYRSKRQNGPIRFLFIGQHEKHKGILFLIKTLKYLSFAFECHIVGEGTCSSVIGKMIAADDRFIYHGFVSFEQIQNLLSITDVLLVPSLCYENSPTVIYESLQAGVPVIASRIGGVGELIKDGKNGMLFEPGNSKDFLRVLYLFEEHLADFQNVSKEIQASVKPYEIKNYASILETWMKSFIK